MDRKCASCRYWSELVGEMNNGITRAMCLSTLSRKKGRMQPENQSCGDWASGNLGAIDDPNKASNRYNEEREESMDH